jgi:hypothetical protein
MMPSNDKLEGRAKVYTIAQIVMSSLGLPISLLLFVLFLVIAVMGFFGDLQTAEQNGSLLVIAWGALIIGCLFIPGLILAIQRLRQKQIPALSARREKQILIILTVFWFVCLLITFFDSNWVWTGTLNSIFVAPLVMIPLIVLVAIGSRKLSSGSPFRSWGGVSFSYFVTIPLILTIEILVFFAIILVIGIWLSTKPDLLALLQQYSEQWSLGEMSAQTAERLLFDLFKNPLVLNGSIFVVAILIPIIEEFLKPMALWFLAGKKLTPSQGFVGGLIAGACFATLETVSAIGSPSDPSWFYLLAGRMGTGLLHVTLSGLVGWGLAGAFHNGGWWRFFLNYLGAVLLHGTWNLFALISGILPILPASAEIGSFPRFLSQIGPGVLVGLALLIFLILIGSNRKLQKQSQ